MLHVLALQQSILGSGKLPTLLRAIYTRALHVPG